MVQLLLDHHPDIGIQDTEGMTALDTAVEEGFPEVAKFLLEGNGIIRASTEGDMRSWYVQSWHLVPVSMIHSHFISDTRYLYNFTKH